MSDERSLEDLYPQVLAKHRNTPSNFFVLSQANIIVHETNPVCGDDITLYLRIVNGEVISASFQGYLCAVGTASASMMSEAIESTSTVSATELVQQFRKMMSGEEIDIPSDLVALKGIRKHRIRVRCALLPWIALEKALCDTA